MTKLPILVTAAAFAAIAVPAHAAFKISATRTGIFLSSTGGVALPLNDAGATTRSFNLPSAKAMVLNYSATCSVGGTSGYVEIDIVVNGAVVAPTVGPDDAFCSTESRITRAAISVRIQGNAGTNVVQIIAWLHAGATPMVIRNSSLLVFDP